MRTLILTMTLAFSLFGCAVDTDDASSISMALYSSDMESESRAVEFEEEAEPYPPPQPPPANACGPGLTYCATIRTDGAPIYVCCGARSDCDAANFRCWSGGTRCAAGSYGCGTSCCLATQDC